MCASVHRMVAGLLFTGQLKKAKLMWWDYWPLRLRHMSTYRLRYIHYVISVYWSQLSHSLSHDRDTIRESVDCLCRHDTPIFPYRMDQNSQTQHLQVLLDTYTYFRSVSVPAKTLKVCKIHSYNQPSSPALLHRCLLVSILFIPTCLIIFIWKLFLHFIYRNVVYMYL